MNLCLGFSTVTGHITHGVMFIFSHIEIWIFIWLMVIQLFGGKFSGNHLLKAPRFNKVSYEEKMSHEIFPRTWTKDSTNFWKNFEFPICMRRVTCNQILGEQRCINPPDKLTTPHRKNYLFFCYSQPLPSLRLGPLKSFLSCHIAIQRLSTRLVLKTHFFLLFKKLEGAI